MSDSAAFGEYACLAEGDNCNCPSLEPQARARAQGVSSDSVDQRISAKDEPELFPRILTTGFSLLSWPLAFGSLCY